MLDEAGRIIEGRRYRHDERGITALCRRLVRSGVELVAIERPDGLLIERLPDADLSVIAIHPNQVAAMRPRFSAAGARATALTASCWPSSHGPIATATGSWCPTAIETKALRALTRAREDLVGTRVALANELRAQLQASGPAPQACSARSIARSRSRSSKRIRRPPRPAVSVSSALHGSSPATATAAASPRVSCSDALHGAAQGRAGTLRRRSAADRARLGRCARADRRQDRAAHPRRSAAR